jgi:hypothetical protein
MNTKQSKTGVSESRKIEPAIFTIAKEEIVEILDELINEEILEDNIKLNKKQTIEVLTYVECDEQIAKEIRLSIKSSIIEVLKH